MLADICERLPGADVERRDRRARARHADRRASISAAAIGYGGPCFPRDNKAFAVLARDARRRTATSPRRPTRSTRPRPSACARIVQSQAAGTDAVGILGLSYKPDTAVVEESPGVMLASRWRADGHGVNIYDPVALTTRRRSPGQPSVQRAAASAGSCSSAPTWS